MRNGSVGNLQRQIDVSSARLETLRGFASSTPPSAAEWTAYTQVRAEEKREEGKLKELELAVDRLAIDRSVREPYALLFVAGAVLGSLLTLCLLSTQFARELGAAYRLCDRWLSLGVLFVLVQFIPHSVGELLSSVLTVNKVWFGMDSWCVSPERFVQVLGMALGTQICIAAALVVGWNCANAASAPKFVLRHPDGRCGVGAYLVFLHRWLIASLIITAIASISWAKLIQYRPEGVWVYGPRILPYLVLVLVLYWRFTERVVEIRRKYESTKCKLGKTFAEVEAAPKPEDPTLQFIGASRWLPGPAVVGVMSFVWPLVELLGLLGTR